MGCYGRWMKPLLVMLAVAAPLTVADLVSKEVMSTQPWALHERSPVWVVFCFAVLVGLLVVCRVPALLVPPAAGLLAAGVLGNALSAVANGLAVPNPLVVEGESTVVAFNLADIWAVGGIVALASVLSVWLIRNRHLFPAGRRARREQPDAVAEDGNTVF